MAAPQECSDDNVHIQPSSTRSSLHELVTHHQTVQDHLTPLVGKGGVDIRADDDDLSFSEPPPISSQNSIDLLVEQYKKMENDDDENVHKRHAIRLAQKCEEQKKEFESLKEKHDRHLAFSQSLKLELDHLKDEREQLIREHNEEGRERVERAIKEKEALIEMLRYGTPRKCGVCHENSKVIDSHPYSRVVLETILGANYSGIFDLQQERRLEPSSCKWLHLCSKCDKATSDIEEEFNAKLVDVLKNTQPANSNKIPLSHADLLHVYAFRSLFYNVDIHHYIPGCEVQQQCSCTESDLFHSLNNFRRRAHHLSRPMVWKGRVSDKAITPSDETITPSEAGMLFHIQHTDDHWLEFPIICKVNITSGDQQRSHYLIFAQIPPYYWAFPLPLDQQDVPAVISDDKKNSKVVVEAHYTEARRDSELLSKEFERIVAEINRKLEMKRSSIENHKVIQDWRRHLQNKKQEVEDEGKRLKEEMITCEKKKETLMQMKTECESKRRENAIRLTEIEDKIKDLKNKEGETSKPIANEEIRHTQTLFSLTDDSHRCLTEEQKLNERMTQCTTDLTENAIEFKKLMTQQKDLIKRGLHADFHPKLIIGYFRTQTCCYLEITLE